MSHTNGGDTSQARVEELQRHIRVLESWEADTSVTFEHFADSLEHLNQSIDQLGDCHNSLRGVLTDMLAKLNELIEAQNRAAHNFNLLLAALRPTPPPAPPPRNVVKPKRRQGDKTRNDLTSRRTTP